MTTSFSARNLINVYHTNIKELCSKIPGSKYLMMHQDIEVVMNKICKRDLLNSCGIISSIRLTGDSIHPSFNKIICLLPSNYESLQLIIEMLKNDRENKIKRNFVLGFVPFLTESCKYLLQKEDLSLDDVGIFDLKIGWIPIDDDLLTLNAPYMFSSSFLHQNTTWCYFFGEMIAEAIIVGLDRPTYTCQFFSLGEAADWCFKGLNDACRRNSSNFKQSDSKTGSTNVFIFSRDVDYVTPFCLPITFEGMLHEVMDINLGEVFFSREVTNEADQMEYMNSNNAVFQDIRGIPLTTVVTILTEKNKALAHKHKKVDNLHAPDQLKSFVENEMKHLLTEGKQLKLCYSAYDHIIKETTINDRVDDLMSAQASLLLANDELDFPRNLIIEFLTCRHETKMFEALRLLCLWTATSDGLSQNTYQEMYRLVCHAAGYPIIYLLHNLRKLRLFAPREDFIEHSDFVNHNDQNLNSLSISNPGQNIGGQIKQMVNQYRSKYYYLRNILKLYSNKQMTCSQDCVHPSFIFGGHHLPLCAAVIGEICRKTTDSSKDNRNVIATDVNAGKPKKNIAAIDEAIKYLKISPSAAQNYGQNSLGSGSSVRGSARSNIETLIVCFIGGCCYAEITALRHLAKTNSWNLIIFTSAILNTKSLIFQVSSDD